MLIREIIQTTLDNFLGAPVGLHSITEMSDGPQGFSGAKLQYFDVHYSADGIDCQRTLVIKEADLHERKSYVRLNAQGASVPFSYSADLVSAEAKPLCIQHAGKPLPRGEHVAQTAQAVAKIHAANLGCRTELSWLPKLDAHYTETFLVDACWRLGWNSIRDGGAFVDAHGNRHGFPKAGGDFKRSFSAVEPMLEAKASQLVETVARLWDEGESLTLIHGDLHHDHVYFDGQDVYLIDWGSAQLGSFYFDLPNYFTRDEALVYRDCLAELGHTVPEAQFLANYDAVKAFVGFKYFGVGLWNWCFGEPPHKPETVMHFVNMIIN